MSVNLTPEQRANVERWVAALRGGRYQQGTEYLRSTEGRFCCLGVACHLIDPSDWTLVSLGTAGETMAFNPSGGKWMSLPPERVCKAFGVTTKLRIDLVSMNDSERKSFPEIADYIERELLGVAA